MQNRKTKKKYDFTRNVIMASRLFAYTKNYSYLAGGPNQSAAIIQAVKLGVQGIEDFFVSRCLLSNHMPLQVQHKVKTSIWKYDQLLKLHNDDDETLTFEYGATRALIWSKTEKLKEKLFENEGRKMKMQMFYFDIPMLHEQTSIGHEFIIACAKTDRIQIFEKLPVQALINWHWQEIKYKDFFFRVLPFLFQLGSFLYWQFIILEQFSSVTITEQSATVPLRGNDYYILLYLQLAFSIYLVAIQIKQAFKQNFFVRFSNLNNLLELVPHLLVFYDFVRIRILPLNEKPEKHFFNLQAILALFMWLQLLNILRAEAKLAALIFSLNTIIHDMIYFIMVFSIIILAFGNAFYILQSNYPSGELLGPNNAFQYSYLMATGTFDTTVYDGFTWVIFLLANILEVIILLNLLIAVISNSFAAIDEKSTIYGFKQRVELIFNFYSAFSPSETPIEAELMLLAIRNESIQSESWLPAKTRKALKVDDEDSDY